MSKRGGSLSEGKLPSRFIGIKSPLYGKRVLVTRSRDKAGSLSQMLEEAGATVVEVPAIEIMPLENFSELDSRLLHLDRYNWVVFGSTRGVEAVLERLGEIGLDVRAFNSLKVAAVGPSVARALQKVGIDISLMPDAYHSQALVRSFASTGLRGQRVLAPSADIGGRILEDGLASLGAMVDRVSAYRTLVPHGSRGKIKDAFAAGIDIVTFTSSSTVTNLLSLLDGRLEYLASVKIACIGPVTSSTARDLGLRVDLTAKEHTLQGLVNSIEEFYGKERS